jgi:hypothetical protein
MYILTGDFSSELFRNRILLMPKKIMITLLIFCSVFALHFDVTAVDSKAWRVYQENKLKEKRAKEARKSAAATRKVFRTILLYIPNRIADVADIFTFSVSAGDFFEWQMQMTRYSQIGGFTGQSSFWGSAYKRQFGTWHKDSHRFGFGFWEKEITVVDETTGSVKEYLINFPNFLIANHRLDAFYYDDVDFWELSFNIGWFAGFGFAMHPIEFADFFTGFFLIDISDDDF